MSFSLDSLKDDQQLILKRLTDQEALSRRLYERLLKSNIVQQTGDDGQQGLSDSYKANSIFELLNRKSQSTLNPLGLTSRAGQHNKGLLEVAMETLFGTNYSLYALLLITSCLVVISILAFCLLYCCLARLNQFYLRIFKCKNGSKSICCL